MKFVIDGMNIEFLNYLLTTTSYKTASV